MGMGKRAHSNYKPPKSFEFNTNTKTLNLAPHTYIAEDGFTPKYTAEKLPKIDLLITYLTYLWLTFIGIIRDFIALVEDRNAFITDAERHGMAPLAEGFETFFTRRMYSRIKGVFNKPITGVPGREVMVLDRDLKNGKLVLNGKKRKLLNLSSYNYLGFSQADGPCSDAVELTVHRSGLVTGSPCFEVGHSDLHKKTEALVARFMGQEDAVIFSMGFATNSTVLPILVGKGDLLISDTLNHSSIVFGARLTGASIGVFKHNDPEDLEKVVREKISSGDSDGKPWKKILIIVEGLYSMEGTISKLPEFIKIKKKYKCYLYMDEAHSIGAMGPNGKGICDFYGVDPDEIDILMGTFTKSFGAAGGYIAGKKLIIDKLRLSSHSAVYSEPMPIPVCQQVYSSMRMIMGEEYGSEGRHRIQALSRNSRFFANELRKMGFIVFGDAGSPVIPVLLLHPAKIAAASQEFMDRGIAVVVVGYPATDVVTSRLRICISSAHTISDLEYALQQFSEVGDRLLLKMAK